LMMFGTNKVTGAKFFKEAEKPSDDALLVTSVWLTLQGEGPFSGMPAVFVRLAHCQLTCSFCDTWFDSGCWYTGIELRDLVMKKVVEHYDRIAWPKHPTILVITGGEPTLQDNLFNFCDRMLRLFETVQIESNGIRSVDLPDKVTLVVSPKCIEKNGVAIEYFKPNYDMLERADCLKFVMCSDAQSPYSQIPDWALQWRQETEREIFVSPMNVYANQPTIPTADSTPEERAAREVISFWQPGLLDMAANQRNHEYVGRYCLRHGLRMNVQLHLLASLG